MTNHAAARLNMVEGQLRTNKVTDEGVIAAFLAIPRERFVPAHLEGIAYVDDDIDLGGGRSLMEPMVTARLLQLAAIGPGDKVLEIGCGTGYMTALIAHLGARVVALECDTRLAATAKTLIAELGIAGARVIEAPLATGYAPDSRYDAIVFSGTVAAIPPAVADQLAEGGRLVAVLDSDVARPGGCQGQAILMTRFEGVLSSRPVFDASGFMLPGLARAPSFAF